MEITVKLFATLRQYQDKVLRITVKEGANVKEVVAQLSIPEEEVAIIMINGRGADLERILAKDDTLSLFPAVGGG